MVGVLCCWVFSLLLLFVCVCVLCVYSTISIFMMDFPSVNVFDSCRKCALLGFAGLFVCYARWYSCVFDWYHIRVCISCVVCTVFHFINCFKSLIAIR